MAKKNSAENIISKIPEDTKLVEFNIGSEGKIESIEVKNMSNVMQNDVMAVNVVLQAFLSAFGIDIASIARTAVPNINTRLIDMRNLLINSKWDTTNVTIDGVTKTAMYWVKKKFNIYDKGDFVDALFRRIGDLIFTSDTDEEYNIIKTDDTTYQMIKLIAMCYGADETFSSVPVGDTEIIPNQRYSTKTELEEILHNLFVAQGLTTEEATVTIPDSMWSGSSDIWHYFNQGNYATVLIHKGLCDNPLNVVYPTNPNFHDMWAFNIIVSEEPITALTLNGWTNVSSNNYCVMYSGTSENNLYGFQTTYNITTSGTYHLFTFMKAFEYLTSENVLNFNYKANSWFRWGDYDSREETPILICLPYQWYRLQGTYTWTDIQTAQDITTDIYLNSSYSDQEVVPYPFIESTVQALIGAFDLLNIMNKFPIFLDLASILATLNIKTAPWDTCEDLKTDRIDINDGTSLRTGRPYKDIVEDISAEYTTKFSLSVDWFNDQNMIAYSPSEWYSVLEGKEEFNAFNNMLWNPTIWTQLKNNYNGITPIDCIKDIALIPFDLKKSTSAEQNDGDYGYTAKQLYLGGYPMDDVYAHDLNKPVRVLHTYPVAIGFKESFENGKKVKVMEDDSFLNYEPYTTASIYIPFVGERQLEMSLIMYKYVYLEYRVFVPTGEFVANVCVYDFNDTLGGGDTAMEGAVKGSIKKAYPILTCSGNMAIHFDLATRQQKNAIDTLTTTLSGLIGAMGGAISGNPALAVAGASQAVNSLLTANQGSTRVNGSSMSGKTGFLSNWIPYISIFRHECIKGYSPNAYNSAFNETIGMKSERGIKIRNMDKGFHKVRGVKLQGIKCTETERQMIEDILLNGFYTATVNDNKEEEGG